MNNNKSLYIAGCEYDNLRVYKLRTTSNTINDVIKDLYSTKTKTEILNEYQTITAKERPHILLQMSNANENHNNTTKFLAVPLSTKRNKIDANFETYIIDVETGVDVSYAKPHEFNIATNQNVDIWYNKDTGKEVFITKEEFQNITSALDDYLEGGIKMNLNFHNMPSSRESLEKSNEELKQSNKELKQSVGQLEQSVEELKQMVTNLVTQLSPQTEYEGFEFD